MPNHKTKTFNISQELANAIAQSDDPIPLQRYLQACIAYRYGLSNEVPRRLEDDLKELADAQPTEELISIREAARRLRVTEAHIRAYLIPKGKLACFKMPDNSLRVYKDLRAK